MNLMSGQSDENSSILLTVCVILLDTKVSLISPRKRKRIIKHGALPNRFVIKNEWLYNHIESRLNHLSTRMGYAKVLT